MNDHTPTSKLRRKAIWAGPHGLRSGWAILLFILTNIAVIVVVGHIAYVLHHPLPFRSQMVTVTASTQIVIEAILCFAVLAATTVMSFIDKRSWLDYGLRASRGAGHLATGALWGVVGMSIMMAMLMLFHGARIEFSADSPLVLLQSGLLWAVAFMLVGLTEEMTFRGYAFFKLTQGIGPVAGTLVMSLLFGLAHMGNHGETIVGILQVVAFGLICCLAVWRTGSLWWVIGFHAAWDWSESFLFGTADSGRVASGHWLTTHATGPAWLSGGSVGPEGSLLVFPILALLTVVILRTLPNTRNQNHGKVG